MWSGVWLFRDTLKRDNFFSPFCCGRLGKKGIVPHCVGGSLGFLMLLFICVWARLTCQATYWCELLATASWFVEGTAPMMRPWCAEEEVPTAANLNLYRRWNSRVALR